MKQRTILSTILLCVLLLAGCGTAAQTPDATVRLLRNDMLTQTSSIFYEQPDGSPFVIGCNVSDIFPDVTVEITTSDGEKVSFSPFISLKDGSVEVGERGLNITRISTAP